MKVSASALAMGLAVAPQALAWGGLGHITTAYVASKFVSNTTEAFYKELLRSDEPDYLARVATWADSIRYSKWARFTKNFHFIDAHDNPPHDCNVDFERDCKEDGCVISALANYTQQSLDHDLAPWLRAQAAKFVIHFVGDLHQPLHNEDVSRGGNGIYVNFDGHNLNLHHVWDSSIAEKWIGGIHRKPYPAAEKWANELALAITDGKFAEEKEAWLKDLNFDDPIATAMAWSRECNALICTHVLPEGPEAIVGKELGGEYFDKAGPVIERQVARGGYRMAAWLEEIAMRYQAQQEPGLELMSEEL
ncbi:putative nuclease S1 precursor [Stachybotrys elegans]|uniref:Nuclease S1 n=1 Tax=Stachybotrys elegans TaxID=80388 RepID=A0A8K0WPP7_9HYPO|nr:putative nuclease S1 precursor [Stachybotrys elegans]